MSTETAHRWNIEPTEDGFRICRGEHHRSADCEWEYFVPAKVQEQRDEIRLAFKALSERHQKLHLATATAYGGLGLALEQMHLP